MKRRIWFFAIAVVAGTSLAGARGLVEGRQRYVLPPADTAAVNGAIAFFESKFRADPVDMGAARRLIQRHVSRFNLTANPADLERMLELARLVAARGLDPAEDEATLSSVLLMQHAFAESYAAASRAVRAGPWEDAARAALFDAALATGRYALADSLLATSDAGALGWRVRRSHLLVQRGDSAAATSVLGRVCHRLERAAARPAVQAWCLTELARLQSATLGPSTGKRTLRRAFAVQPGYRGAVEALADQEHARGAWNQSRALYRRIAGDAHPDLYLRLAEAERELGNSSGANRLEREFLRVARSSGAEPLYGLVLAEFYARSPVTRDTALAIMQRELDRRPAVETYQALGRVLDLLGHPAQARRAEAMGREIVQRTPCECPDGRHSPRSDDSSLSSNVLRVHAEARSRGEESSRCRAAVSRSLAGLSCAALLMATEVRAQAVVQRDSTGVRVIEVAGSGLDGLPTWRLEGPTVRIEADKGGPEYELNRASSPWRLTDGRIVLANNQVELRFFDSTGVYLNTVARRGRGPGEYQQLLRVFRAPGDSLLAFEVVGSRIDVRDPTGKLIRSFNISRALSFAGIGGQGAVYEEYKLPDLGTVGTHQERAVLRQLNIDGKAGQVVARLPGSWIQVVRMRGEPVWRGVRLSGSPMLAGRVNAVYVHGDEFAAYWFGDAGRLQAITRVALPRARVTAADRRNDERRRQKELELSRIRVVPGSPPAAYATWLPQVTRVVVDRDGRAWLRRWTRDGARDAEWVVLAPFGPPIARITMPAALQPNDVGANYVLGILTDEDGVQSVYLYDIVR